MRRGFTLVELLIVISIISILAAMAALALAGAAESGRIARARTQIIKIDQLINERWNGYRYRAVPLRKPFPPNDPMNSQVWFRQQRLGGLRELQRMELPERYSDIETEPTLNPTYGQNGDPRLYRYLAGVPSMNRAYRRKLLPTRTPGLEQSECLYLILSEMRDGDRSALNVFMSSEIGDTDGDGMNEILDPWGTPIIFFRWAPGYSKVEANAPEMQNGGTSYPPIVSTFDTFQIPNGNAAADSFDPLKCDPRWSAGPTVVRPFLIRPLIVSAGPDKQLDLWGDLPAHYRDTPTVPNDPYVIMNGNTNTVSAIDQPPTADWRWMGQAHDFLGDGLNTGDNIANHGVALEGE